LSISWGNIGWHNDGRDYSFTENLSWAKGSHILKFGFHYNRDNKKQTAGGNGQGSISFNGGSSVPLDTNSGLANLMLGNFSSYTQPNVHVYPYFRFQSWEAFAQDSWKITRRGTLEFGLRFQHTTPTYTYLRDGAVFPQEGTFKLWSVDIYRFINDRAPMIEINRSSPNYGKIIGDAYSLLPANGLICDPCDGVERGFAEAKTLFAPRLGFAYDLSGNGRTALRGGVGIFNERLRQNNFNFNNGNVFPNISSASHLNGNVGSIDMSVTGARAAVTPPGYRIFPVDNDMPSIYSWNLGIQQELVSNFTLDVSYVGNRATHLMLHRYINGLPAGTYLKYPNLLASVNSVADMLRPYRGYGQLTNVETSGYSNYHGMLLRASRRFANRFSFNVNYTWSKSMGLVDNDDGTIINAFDLRQNYTVNGFDMTHYFAADYIYQLPKFVDNAVVGAVINGWQLSGITRFVSGRPADISSNGNMQCIDCGSARPNLTGDPFADTSKWQYFNPNAFQRPLDGQYGGLKRNTLRLPGINNFDLSITKNVRWRETVGFMIRAEAYNVFNHPQIYNVNTSFTADNQGGPISANNKTFGKPTAWRDARVVQLGFKLTF